jgi:hypothetical protein
MAYRAPRYSYVHAARDVGALAIDFDDDGAADADYPVDNMIDDRAGTLFKFSAASTAEKIQIDLGDGFDTGLTRLIIPANHNLTHIRIYQDDLSDYSTEAPLTAGIYPTPGVLIDYAFPATTKRYLRLGIDGDSTVWQLPQFVLTKIETLTVGPDLANSADGYRANVTRLIQNTGLMPSILHGPQQRVMEYDYAPIEGTDLATMEALIATVGMDRPFFVDPASFSATPWVDDPPIWMKFDDMPESRHTVLVPMSNAESKAFSFRLIESLD